MNGPIEYKNDVVLVCAWHLSPRKEILEGEVLHRHPTAVISHGICRECRARVLAENSEEKADQNGAARQ